MIIRSYSNIDIIQGIIGYGNVSEGITDWRITNTNTGVFNILNSSSIIRPSGGTSEIREIPGTTDIAMIFTAGTSTFTVPAEGIVCDILVVGGGGGGGKRHGGGGGAGTLLYHKNITLNGTYNIIVGGGGTGVPSTGFASGNTVLATSGNFSQFIKSDGSQEYYANGGGRGGGWSANALAITNGGRTYSDSETTLPLTNKFNGVTVAVSNKQYVNTLTSPEGCRGNVGGLQVTNYKGGGGGGAGGVGMNHDAENTVNDGYGGLGLAIDITGTSIVYAGGGNGSDFTGSVSQVFDPSYPTIQSRGGGGFGSDNGTPQNGLDGTGGGGGAQGDDSNGNPSGNGGSGIVIIRYSKVNISIIDNGNVGIGITPITNSSLLEIGGNINITGIYKKNNRNVVSDINNYVLTTSNLLVNRIVGEVTSGSNYTSRINTELLTKVSNTSNYVLTTNNSLGNRANSQWTSVNAGIYYTKTIPTITSTPQPPIIISNDIGTVRIMSFTYTTETAGAGTGQTLYTINVPTNITCDILVIGGGGGGGTAHGGGGGAGALIYLTSQTLSSGNITIRVGKGGLSNARGAVATNGFDTSIKNSSGIDIYLAKGGGGGRGAIGDGANGGSGGGGNGSPYSLIVSHIGGQAVSTNIPVNVYGNIGGNGAYISTFGADNTWSGGGGGGAGSAGINAVAAAVPNTKAGNGGNGLLVNITGTALYYAGGGGGGCIFGQGNPGSGGLGGGGDGKNNTIGVNGTPNTGGGGGGGGFNNGDFAGGEGGSGIVIIRYVLPAGNVGVGTSNPVSKLHVYDDTTNNTTLTIQNNYTEPITIFPTTGYALTETIENNIYYRALTFSYYPLKNYPIIPPTPSNPPNTTLLAWYKFNGDGLDYNTSATKYNLIANTGIPTYSSGTTEDSFFQGLRYINTATGSLKSTTLSLNSRAFSIALWMRKKNSSIALFIAQSASLGSNTSLHIGQRENNVYTIDFYGNGLNSASSYPEDINAWAHIVYVVLANYNRRIYRNGVLIASDSNTTAFSGTGDLRIGAHYSDNTNQNIDISDLRIYTTGLSATDVATLYASYTPLLAWYRFDGDGLDYNPYATKYNLIADEGTVTYSSGTTADSFFQGRRYINTAAGSLKNTTLALASRAFSVSMWLRFKIAGQGASILCQSITQTTNTTLYIGARGNAGYFLGFHNNDLECGVGVGGPTSYPGDINTWVHLVYVVLPNYNRRIYRNGVLISADGNTSAFTGTGELSFNKRYWNGNAYVNADISDFRIYTTGLSATDVATLYASYSNIVTSDNYTVNFANTSRILVNSAYKTVNGAYGIYTGDSNLSMLPLSGQSDTPLITTTSTGTSSVVVKYAYNQNILPTIISGFGITSTIVGNTDVCSIFTYTGTPATNPNTTYTFTTTEPYICDILIIGGGGAGGDSMGGGGGAGGVVYSINQILPASTYKVNVGRGGIGLSTAEEQGTAGTDQDGIESSLMNSDGSSYISQTLGGVSQQLRGYGGGGGGVYYNASFLNGRNGGSGGGCTENNPGFGLNTPGSATQGNTYWNGSAYVVGGKAGRQNTTTTSDYQGGGGGGLGDISSDYRNGNGGVSISITGTSRFYAAGGGAGQYIGASTYAGFGGSSIGGNGRVWTGSAYAAALRDVATSGTNGTGSGGGGTAYTQAPVSIAGSGGSGVVIIRYRKLTSASFELINVGNNINDREPIIPGTTVVPIPGTLYKYVLFPYTTTTSGLTQQTQYTFTATEDLNCEILVVAGGGGGAGSIGGGGGAGAVVHIPSGTLSAGSYNIIVGNGGESSSGASANGYNSSISGSFGTIIAEGGGGVTAGFVDGDGRIGGSGGGASGNNGILNYGAAAGTSSSLSGFTGFIYGNRGGNNTTTRSGNTTNASGGGGAGSAAADTNVNGSAGGNGGAGILITITGNNVYYGGGGGGAGHVAIGGSGGIGGGGDGVREDRVGYPGAPNTGGGGGGGGWSGNFGGSGGSGVVIIKYLRSVNLTNNYKIGNYNGDFKIISSLSTAVSSTVSSTLTSSDIEYMRITANGASIYNPTGTPQWSTVSDRRIKENIEKASYDKCYENINKLELYRFNYIKELNNINKDLKQLGYIAQEVEDIFPKAVSTQPFYNNSLSISDLLSIDISQINYSLYGAVKKLIEIDKNKEARIKKMEYLLNIDTPPASNITIDTLTSTSNNITIDTSISTSNNMYINFLTSNNMYIDIDISTSNNIRFYTPSESSFIIVDTITSTSNNISFYTPAETNIIIDTLTTSSNIIDNLSVSNMSIYTSNNIIYDISTSNNISFYTSTETNIIIDITKSTASNIAIE
jgi:hypothetical protein